MDTRLLLQKNCERLLEQYETNLKVVQELQYTMIEDVLPSVAGELALDSGQINWAKQWLEDARALLYHLQYQLIQENFLETIFQLLRVRVFRLSHKASSHT